MCSRLSELLPVWSWDDDRVCYNRNHFIWIKTSMSYTSKEEQQRGTMVT